MTRLATILIRPRQTIRSIVAESRSSLVILPLVLLATVSTSIRDVRWQAYHQSPQLAAMMPSASIICAGLAGILIGALLLFYVFALLAWGIGRLLGGTADGRAVRLALAWSLAPLIWALLYRIPVTLFQPAMGRAALLQTRDTLAILHAAAGAMSLYAVVSYAVITVVTIAVDIWCLVIAGVALSEVNGFSTWRGAATLGFALLAPLIVVAAYFISRAV
jgi:Yip1 domain